MEVKFVESEKRCPCRKCDEEGKNCVSIPHCRPFQKWFKTNWREIQASAREVRK